MAPVTGIQAHLPAELEQPVADRLAAAADQDVVARIGRRDGTLWAPEGTPEVTDRLAWLTIADEMLEQAGELDAFRAICLEAGYTDAVLLGMGGSSLAPETFRLSYGPQDGGLRLHVLDSTDPDQIVAVEGAIDVERTLFIVSTKSGGTIETLSLFKHFHALQDDGEHFVAVTDPGSSLEDLAAEHGFRRVFLNEPDIGGRYSALSYFGLVPAALAGIDVRPVLEGAQAAQRACAQEQDNPGLWLGCALGELARNGRDKLTWVADEPIASFGVWAEQLVAESTGKQRRGILPIADEPLGGPEAYGNDRVFVHLRADGGPGLGELAEAGHPVITIPAAGPQDLGRLFFLSEFATAVVGWALEINPFDQPNVQEAKDATKKVLDEGTPELEDGDLAEIADGLAPPHYVAIMGYLPYSAEVDAAFARLRAAITTSHRVATTYGYGPRFLHSTGQFHKGGPAVGRFIQLVHDSQASAAVPGESFDFGTLIRAQADGDLQTLRGHGLTAVRIRLSSGDLARAIDDLKGNF